MIAASEFQYELWMRAAVKVLSILDSFNDMWQDEALQLEAIIAEEELIDDLYSRQRTIVQRILAKEMTDAGKVLQEIWSFELHQHNKNDTLDEFEVKYGLVSEGITQQAVHRILTLAISQVIRKTTLKNLQPEGGKTLAQMNATSQLELLNQLKASKMQKAPHILFNFFRHINIEMEVLRSPSDLAMYEVELRYHFTKTITLRFVY